MIEGQKTETERNERKLTFVIDDDALFNAEKANDEPASFLELATALAQRKWFILKMTAGAGVIGVIVALLLPNWYTAETKILPPQQQESTASALLNSLGSAGGGLGALASAAGGSLGLKNPNDLYVGMLKTRPIADAIIQRFDLQKLYKARDMTDTRKALANHTDIVSGKDGMISVSVEDKDKKRAAEMANAYIQELRNLSKGLALTEPSQRRLFYEEQLKGTKEDLAKAELGLKQAQQKTGVIEPGAQAQALIQGVGDLRAQIVAKEVELRAMRSFATDKNPDVDIAQQELAGLKAQLKKLESQSGNPSNFEVNLKDVPQAELDYIRAARELKFQETLFTLLSEQFEIAKMDEARDSALIQVVEPATPPDQKSSPKRAVICILSAMAGCFLACLVALTGWWRRRMLLDPERDEQLKAFRAAVMGK
ncbi:MAG TPA: Wzz/FepE/Etk N-terminal domain-containing protein [Candidatus Angelobacter sp.]|nr:Wzz/FepE/Etk N-terminal domain-containing protein [Candidatus Angelobacter sp.]